MAKVEDDAERIAKRLGGLPGGSAGNKSMRLALSLSEADYWAAHAHLLHTGRVLRGRGKGGSLILVPTVGGAAVQAPPSVASAPPTPGPNETSWYPALETAIRDGWRHEQGFDEIVVEVTAHQGRRNTCPASIISTHQRQLHLPIGVI